MNDDVGIDPDGVGQPDPPLVARGGGIGWIGSSFYFIHLDLSLKPHPGLPEGAHDEAWQVHGGGFYRIVKFLVAPAKMPDELTWFKWEAYTTWLSGIALMVVVYYFDSGNCSQDVWNADVTCSYRTHGVSSLGEMPDHSCYLLTQKVDQVTASTASGRNVCLNWRMLP